MQISVPPNIGKRTSSETTLPVVLNQNLAFLLYYVFKTIPLLVAALAIYLGYRLFILGVTGQASLSVESRTMSGQLLNAAPGLFFAVGGVVTMIVVVWKGVEIKITGGGRGQDYYAEAEEMKFVLKDLEKEGDEASGPGGTTKSL